MLPIAWRYCAAVALDADGTLLTSQHVVCPQAAVQLQRLQHYAPSASSAAHHNAAGRCVEPARNSAQQHSTPDPIQPVQQRDVLSAAAAIATQHHTAQHAFALVSAAGSRGVLRIIATGRNLRSVVSVLPKYTPIDFVVAGSGGVCVRWPSQEEVFAHSMRDATAVRLCRHLVASQECHFFALRCPPMNHVSCAYHCPDLPDDALATLDFAKRCRVFADLAAVTSIATAEDLELEVAAHGGGAGSIQGVFGGFFAMGSDAALTRLTEALMVAFGPDELRMVRTTSPTDSRVTWLEMLPSQVSKALAVARLAEMHGIPSTAVVAVGNDYNDLDMLESAAAGLLVANAPEPLRRGGRFIVLKRTNDEGGVAEALVRFFPKCKNIELSSIANSAKAL